MMASDFCLKYSMFYDVSSFLSSLIQKGLWGFLASYVVIQCETGLLVFFDCF